MKMAVIRSSWMAGYGYRLDCSPYLGGALETKILLEKLPLRKDKLHTLTAGFDGGIFNGPQFSRTFVESPEHGVPFIGSSAMLHADLSELPLLSKKQAMSTKLAHLELKRGMSLISCSGTIGKMVYGRRDMEGIWSSQHVMKVVADPNKIPSGYLYAFLSSKFGVPLVVSGTYGSIIQTIMPDTIKDLPVPRLGNALEHEIHALVEEAAELRTRAVELKRVAIEKFHEVCGVKQLPHLNEYRTPHFGVAKSVQASDRLDSTYYIKPCDDARKSFDAVEKTHGLTNLGDVAQVFVPTIFKREYADDPEFGVPYITGADVFCVTPETSLYLVQKVVTEHRLMLETGMILIHEAGSRYGLIGRCVMVGDTLNGFACTNNMVRVVPHDSKNAGYIFAALSSEVGIRLLKREAAGSAIPHLDERRIRTLTIPWPRRELRERVAAFADQARANWDKANELEQEADSKLVDALAIKAK